MKKVLLIIVSLVVAIVLPQIVLTGDLDGPAWGPQSGGGMYSLSDLYYYLTEGTAFTATTSFTEPAQGPTVPTGVHLKTICDDIKASFGHQRMANYDRIAPNVEQGYVFFCTDTNYWGVQEGTKPTSTPTPTPSPSPIPTPTPWGYPDVVQIGSMYVASSKDGTGCAGNGTKQWAAACSWGDNLNWLGKSDWRLPTKDELHTICLNSASLASSQSDRYWSSTAYGGSWAWLEYPGCGSGYDPKTDSGYVRAVRSSD